MKFVKTVFGILTAVVLFSSCKNVDYKKTTAGVPYKVYSSDKGDSIHQNYIVKFEVIQKIKDSVLYSSYKEKRPEYLQVNPVSGPLNYTDIKNNILEILPKVKKGDSIYIVQSTDSLIKANPQAAAQFKKGEQISTSIKIEEVYKNPADAEAAITKENVANSASREKDELAQFQNDATVRNQMAIDNKIIEDYLAANHIQATKTPWGAYIQVLDPGQGPKPQPGQFANVKYKGSSLQGETFDSGVFPVQVGMGGAIKGFEEGVRQLAKGGKAKVYVPSMLGYGPRGSEPKIKPNEVLMFDLEVLDISNTRPQQQPMMPVDTTAAAH